MRALREADLARIEHARMHEALRIVKSFLAMSIYGNFKNKSVINSNIQNNKKVTSIFYNL
jgi:hypothetical protein